MQNRAKQHSKRFHEFLKVMGDLHDKKNSDYGADEDSLSNFRGASEWNVRQWVGCMIRAEDKIKRLKTFAKKGNLKNESVRDSFIDLANYTIIGLILFEEEEARESSSRLSSHSSRTKSSR